MGVSQLVAALAFVEKKFGSKQLEAEFLRFSVVSAGHLVHWT